MSLRAQPAWGSVSRVEALDRADLLFAYETRNTDGNPSYAKWTWHVTGSDGGSTVSVSWNIFLKTVDRRYFAGPLRKRQLAREVPRSLAQLGESLASVRPQPFTQM